MRYTTYHVKCNLCGLSTETTNGQPDGWLEIRHQTKDLAQLIVVSVCLKEDADHVLFRDLFDPT